MAHPLLGLALHFDENLNWQNIFIHKGNKLDYNILLKSIIKPVWTYGIQLWGIINSSNIEILQHFQNRVLRALVNGLWYVPNTSTKRP